MEKEALLSVEETYRLDQAAIAGGMPGEVLMERAGEAVVRTILSHYPPCKTLVLCGPGNNGGDGFAVARLLATRGFDVTVGLWAELTSLKGDAALMSKRWTGKMIPLLEASFTEYNLVIDALFGIGLSRPVADVLASAFGELERHNLPVVAIDIPSGVHGNTGEVLGAACRAVHTVTFTTKKPGHLLYPGRKYAGEVTVADIGIPSVITEKATISVKENSPALWIKSYPMLQAEQHKYSRGAVLVSGGEYMVGASKLVSLSALRMGAGLVKLLVPEPSFAYYAASLLSVVLSPEKTLADYEAALKDTRIRAVVLGPGHGVNARTEHHLKTLLATAIPAVIDADALTVLAQRSASLYPLHAPCVLTPHAGEFTRLFPDLKGDKLTIAIAAAKRTGSVIVLKGADTVIAHPLGHVVINSNAPAWLATAGSGDVLSGMIAGLIAQGEDPFNAACTAVWVHGKAAQTFSYGMIAEDLLQAIPSTLQFLTAHHL